ncbi:MAG TPA: hypothetical protein VGX21_20010 [Methylomirabilota bacterium]|nr:hypothetical protein [Methylomirabilota bacterium]
MSGGSVAGPGAECRCGAALPAAEAAWGCTECGGDCCTECGFWLESTVYCPGCTDQLLAA